MRAMWLFCLCLLTTSLWGDAGQGNNEEGDIEGAKAEKNDIGELPLWEVGIGAAYLNLPQYVGSDQRTKGALPVPYFVYRGEALRISRDSLQTRLFKRSDLVIDLSADFSLPVDSKENRARDGMSDIDFVLEIGPALRWIFYNSGPERRKISLELPLRAVLQSDLRYISHDGWRANPRLRYREHFGPWFLSVWGGFYWNDARYNNLFYGVDENEATPGRQAYKAEAGYGGWAMSTSLTYRRHDWWVGGFIRYYNVRQATFSNSDLVVEPANLGFGLAAAWIISSSKKNVSRWD